MSTKKRTFSLPIAGETRAVRVVGIAILVLLALTAPFIVGQIPVLPYRSVFTGIAFGFSAVGIALLLRHLNLISFGHAAFFGGGAYAVAILVNRFEVTELFVVLIAGTIAGTVLAAIIGLFVKSHLAIFFSLLTLAFNQVIYAFATRSEFLNFTDGLSVRAGGQRPEVLGVTLGFEVYNLFMHYLTVVILAVCLYFFWRVANSPFGRTLYAIGQDRTRARFLGINVERYVFIAFVLSGAIAALGGSLWALFNLHVRPESALHVFRSGEMIFMAILGGFETIIGPIIGGVILKYLLDTMHVSTEFFNAATGILLILIVFTLPKGIAGSNISEKLDSARDDPSSIKHGLVKQIRRVTNRIGAIGDELNYIKKWK